MNDMNGMILAITSSTPRVGCAIGDSEGVLAVVQATRGRRHGELLAAQISNASFQAGVALQDISVVAVDVGPGLYTGLRVGVMTAVAVAYALRVPMMTFSSLDILAFGVRHAEGLVASVIDARRGEVFWSLHKSGFDISVAGTANVGGVKRLSNLAVASADQAVKSLEACVRSFESADSVAVKFADSATGYNSRRSKILAVGDGVCSYSSLFTSFEDICVASKGFAYPSAESLLCMASDMMASGMASTEYFVSPEQVTPLYLRHLDAKPLTPAVTQTRNLSNPQSHNPTIS